MNKTAAKLITITTLITLTSAFLAHTNPLGQGAGTLTYIIAFTIMGAPIWIAILRSHPSAIAISTLTIFLGWTIIGWLIALLWSGSRINWHNDNNTIIVNNHHYETSAKQ